MNYLNWAMIGTGLTMLWGYISGFASRLRSLIIVNVILQNRAQEAFMFLLWNEFQRSKFGDRLYLGTIGNVIPEGRVLKIGIEGTPQQKLLFWKGWVPLLAGAVAYNNSPDTKSETISISYLRGTLDFENLLIKAFDLLNNQKEDEAYGKRFFLKKIFGTNNTMGNRISPENQDRISSNESPKAILENLKQYRLLKWKHEEIGAISPKNPFQSYSFPKNVQSFIKELQKWNDSKEWFLEKRIPWRCGCLLYGKPGSGKSSLVRCLGQLLDFPIYIYDLSSLTNSELSEKWQEMMSTTPCIALFEDIDGVFHGRKNIKSKNGITFDCLLNCISGVEPSDGIITIVTTNDLSKIDSALGTPDEEGKSSRPGRLDRMIELSLMDVTCRLDLAKKILADCPDEIAPSVKISEGYTAAQTQELFCKIALAHYWDENKLKS